MKDCTLACTEEQQCKMPEMMGVKFDFMTCSTDGQWMAMSNSSDPARWQRAGILGPRGNS